MRHSNPPTFANLLLLVAGSQLVVAQDEGAKVDLGPIGVLPMWLLVVIIIILVGLCGAFGYLFWRRAHGSGDVESVPAAVARGNRFRESGNWKKRFSRVMKEEEQQQSEIFREGTILAELSNAQRNPTERKLNRAGSGRKPGEPLVTLTPNERPAIDRQLTSDGPSRSNTRSGHLVDIQRKPTTQSSRSAVGHSSRRDAESARSAGSSGDTLNDEHDLLSSFRANGHGDLGLGSGFSNVPISSVIKIEDEVPEPVPLLSTSPPADSSMFPTMRSTRSGRSGELTVADDYKSYPTRSGTVKSGISKKSVSRTGSQSKHQRRDASPPPSSPRRSNSHLLPPLDMDGSAFGGYIPSPPAYTAKRDLDADDVQPLARHASRSDRNRFENYESRSPARVDRSRSTRSKAPSVVDEEWDRDREYGRADRERERARERERGRDQDRSRRPNKSRSRTREGANRTPRSPTTEDDSDSNRPLALNVAMARTRSKREAPVHRSPSNAAASSVKRTGTSRSTRHHEGSSQPLSRSASSAVGSSRRTTRHEAASDDETPLASVALQALQQNMGVSLTPAPTGPNADRRPSRSQKRTPPQLHMDNEENVPLGKLPRTSTKNGTEVVTIDY
ncbi:hypothetical protein DFJ77DRAFT_294501 [Powellomyces hirtus]|nr:hypothetical protein DFJ77DRAFT_294501 [Powellomyces hirtus]